MEDSTPIPITILDTPKTNLFRINSAFHDHCLLIILSSIGPRLILCDFPSRIQNPPPNISIYGLDDFPVLLNAALPHPNSCIYIITQKTTINRKLLFQPCPLQKPCIFLTRASKNSPYELKIHASPNKIQEALLTSTDLSISVPPSFLSATKRIAFEYRENSLHVRLLKVSDIGVL